jgi:broad specificity phosphatase PhoE
VAVVVHGNLIRLLIALMAELDPSKLPAIQTSNTSVTILHAYRAYCPIIMLANCVAHLDDADIT